MSSYLDLIDRFIGRDISAPDLEKSFLRAVKDEQRTLGNPVHSILQELFEEADAYVEQAELRTEPEDLDDDQLLARALRARDALRGLGYKCNAVNFAVSAGQCLSSGKGVAAVMFWMTHCGLIERR